jgi:hypothetical protein
VTDGAFDTLFPQATSYAEQRIYHDMPALAQRLEDTTLLTTAGSRSLSLYGTALPILVPERISLTVTQDLYLVDGYGNKILDGYGNPIVIGYSAQYKVQYLPVSLAFIDMVWPNATATWGPASALGTYWAIQGGVSPSDFISPTIVIAPTPDAAYPVTVTGLFQQPPISAANPQTYLSTLYPEVLTAACMVYLSGALLRNYGSAGSPSQPDEVNMPIHWEGQYGRLIEIAKQEEARRRQQGTDFLYRLPGQNPTAPPR